jgi:hypothetical protein
LGNQNAQVRIADLEGNWSKSIDCL